MSALDLVPTTTPRTRVVDLFGGPVGSVDRYTGTMLGVGIGDALGRPGESRSPDKIRRRYGSLTEFHRWRGWNGGPVGTITDDTQMTMCIAESIVARGTVDPEDIARRFVDWLPVGRGKGRTCVAAIERLQSGHTWETSGVASAGNGAAMRVAPVGLLRAADPLGLRRDAALSAVITHADPTAALSAIAQAAAVAYLTRCEPGTFSVDAFLSAITTVMGDLPDPGVAERRAGAGPGLVRMLDRLVEAGGMLDLTAADAMARLHNGAFVLESLPAAWWFFLRDHNDAERGIVAAADAGYDADTVASMAGALFGALHGAATLPDRWLDELEYRDELDALGRAIHDLAARGTPA